MSQGLGELLRNVNDGSFLCDIESLQDINFLCKKNTSASLLRLISNSLNSGLDVPIKVNVPLTYWARTYLQPHYGNGVFGNVYISTGQH